MKVEHIGIAVADLAAGRSLYERLLGYAPYKEERVESEGVTTLFFQQGETKVELLAALSESSPIAKFIEKRGPGIHHIAFEVADIRAEMDRLRQAGFQLLHDEPRPGADNKLICFVHPKSSGGVLVELCQSVDPAEL